jgi:enoyl-CoA hydratase
MASVGPSGPSHNDANLARRSGPMTNRREEYVLEKPIEETIIVEPRIGPGIARLTLNRPGKHNALFPPEGFQVVSHALTELAERDDVKVIVLCGAGPSFCSGDDLNRTPFEAFGGKPGEKLPQSKRIVGIRQTTDLFRTIVELPKPVVVKAHGTLLGAGFQMALCSDIVVAGKSAKFSRAEQRIGFAGQDPWTSQIAILTIGLKRARELLLSGRAIDADTAYDWGLVNEVVPDDELDEAVMRWARGIAAHSMDGLVIGRQHHQVTLSNMGFHQTYAMSMLSHPLFTNLVWREDEWNFLRERNAADRTSDAFHEREQRWKDAGGF